MGAPEEGQLALVESEMIQDSLLAGAPWISSEGWIPQETYSEMEIWVKKVFWGGMPLG